MINSIQKFHKSTVLGLSGKDGDAKVELISNIGLDVDEFKIGWVSGQIHHRQTPEWMKPFIDEKLLVPAKGNHKNGGVSYGCFGHKGYVIPLKDKDSEIVNLFAFYPNHVTKEPEFLNDNGLFPKYPKTKTTRLFILNDVISTASLIQSDALGNRDQAISLFDGELKPQIIDVIRGLENLNELIFIGVNDEIINELASQFPNLQVSTVELPECESMNDMLLTYGDGVEAYIDEQLNTQETVGQQEVITESGLIQVNPQLHTIDTVIGTFKVKGKLPLNLGDIRTTVKLDKCNDYKLCISDFNKVNQFKGWLIKQYGYDSSDVEIAVNELTEAIEVRVEEIVNDYHDNDNKEIIQLTPKMREKALNKLKSSDDVLGLFNEMLGKTGIVGDEKTRTLSLVIAISYKFKYQLHGIIQASSGSGKTYLVKSVLKCIPKEGRMDLTSVSNKALDNSTKDQLSGKFIVFEDLTGVTKGAMYSLRESQSSNEISYMTVETNIYGEKETVVKTSKTDFASIMTTTRTKIYYDNSSRAVLMGIDESQAQTDRITEYENAIYRGEIDFNKQDEVRIQIANMIRVLDSYEVINPYAGKVILPRQADSYRRLNTQFNYVINIITLLNQQNRKKDKQGRLVTELQDVKQAIEVFYGCIKLKMDDLASSQRNFYERLKEAFPKNGPKEPEFTRKEVEEALNLKKSICSHHLGKLVDYGYLGDRGNKNKGLKYRIIERDDFKRLEADTLNDLMNQIDSSVA